MELVKNAGYGGIPMKHLIDPLDFTVEEIDSFLDLADKIAADPKNSVMYVMERSWLPYFMSRVLEPD